MMNRIFRYAAMALAVFVLLSAIPVSFADNAPEIQEIHVSAYGNDLNGGTAEKPVKSFEKARDIYRSLGENVKAEIVVHAGVYRREKSLELTARDNGMTIRAYGDGDVFVRGSVALPQETFRKADEALFLKRLPEESRGMVYCCNLENYVDSVEKYPRYMPLHGGTGYYELFSGGVAQNIARWPNFGYAKTGNVGSDGVTFEVNDDRIAKWKNADCAMVCGYFAYNWSFENIYIKDVDVENSSVSLSGNLEYGDKVLKGKRFFAMNMPEELDMAGEYYIDAQKKMLYYYPDRHFSDEAPELSVLSSALLRINNASDINISGITFEYTRGEAIYAVASKNITIDDCVVRNIGGDGIWLDGTANTVKGCEVYNIGAAGIRLVSGDNVSARSGRSMAINNNIYNFGRIFRTYQPGIFLAGFGNSAEYNTIHDAPHCAVRFTGSQNKILHNDIYNVVLEGSDSSAVYCGRNWTCWGNEISYNYFHDIKKSIDDDSYTVSAIYMDDLLCGTKVSDNVFEDCSRAMFFGGGKGNIVTGHIVADCESAIDYDNRGVTGEWGKAETVPGKNNYKTAYDGFLKFISDSSFDESLWEGYDGFAQLAEDVRNYERDILQGAQDVTETGYPKNVTIKGNRFYGNGIDNDDYIFISDYVYTYGEVSDNESAEKVPQITMPQNGADQKKWSARHEVTKPGNGEVFEYGKIDFTWLRAGGADCYEVLVTDESGNTAACIKTKENGCFVELEKSGKYFWRVSAVCNGFEKNVIQRGEFSVKKDAAKCGTLIAGSDFDGECSLTELKKQGWDFEVCEGDVLSLEKDASGNGYLRFERNENNLYSTKPTFAKLVFPEKSSGTITVTYDIMPDNFRGAWRDMGSVKTADDRDVVRLLTHMSYFYGVKTTGGYLDRYAYDMRKLASDSYATIKRTLDLDNNTYELWIFQNGEQISYSGVRQCPDGEAGVLLFRLGYQSPFEPCGGSGNAVYKIDNVRIDAGELAPQYTYPANGAENAEPGDVIRIKWNDKLNSQTITKESVKIKENGTEISDYTIESDGRNIYIKITGGMKYSSLYNVELMSSIAPDSLSHTNMSEDYVFSFSTVKKENKVHFAEGFEEYSTGEMPQNPKYEISVAEGDVISVEKDQYGSKALKMVRNEQNLESRNPSYLKINLDGIDDEEITVSFDIRQENYRGGIKNLATLTDGSKNIISSLFTHSKYLYGMTTKSGFNFTLDTVEKDKYITVKRKINVKNGTYDVFVYKDGALVKSRENLPCYSGEPSVLMFEMAYQAPYTIIDGEDDAVYWIDNIRIDADEMRIYKTAPADNSQNDNAEGFNAVFNCDIDEVCVNYDTVKVYRYSNLLSADKYSLSVEGNILKITFAEDFRQGEGCIVNLSRQIAPKNPNTISPMQTGYSFCFSKSAKEYFEKTAQIVNGVLEIDIRTNLEKYTAVIAKRDESGRLVGVQTINCTKNQVIKIAAEENMTVYFWDDILKMNPVGKPWK